MDVPRPKAASTVQDISPIEHCHLCGYPDDEGFSVSPVSRAYVKPTSLFSATASFFNNKLTNEAYCDKRSLLKSVPIRMMD